MNRRSFLKTVIKLETMYLTAVLSDIIYEKAFHHAEIDGYTYNNKFSFTRMNGEFVKVYSKRYFRPPGFLCCEKPQKGFKTWEEYKSLVQVLIEEYKILKKDGTLRNYFISPVRNQNILCRSISNPSETKIIKF